MSGKTPRAQVAEGQDHLGHKWMQQPNAISTRAKSAYSQCVPILSSCAALYLQRSLSLVLAVLVSFEGKEWSGLYRIPYIHYAVLTNQMAAFVGDNES